MDGMHFGIFHTSLEKTKERFESFLQADYLDTFIVETLPPDKRFDEALNGIASAKKNAWIAVTQLGFKTLSSTKMVDNGSHEEFNPTTILLDDYKERIKALASYLRSKPYYEAILGFYMDEPLLWNISKDDFRVFTKAFREEMPEKRFFVCFSIAGVAPSFWTINGIQPIDKETVKYLTDIAFDMYHPFDEKYEAITNEMLEKAGNDGLNVWFIPCVMNYRGDKSEEHCLKHLAGCYDLLKKMKHPGGLFCYTYFTFPAEEEALNNLGLDVVLDPKGPWKWETLGQLIEKIGREIIG